MPKSKRDRKVTLAKTEKKVGLESKQKLVDRIRQAIDEYSYLYVFTVENMRNSTLKEIRETWRHSRFFLGKNRVMSLALGRSEEEEYSDNLFKVSKVLRNQCGLLLTNESKDNLVEFFENFEKEDFARTGGVAQETVVINEGPMDQFPHSLEPQLRQLGLPTSLKRGVIHCIKEHTICRQGEILSSEQARLLKLFGHQQAKFRIHFIASWRKKDGQFELLMSQDDTEQIGAVFEMIPDDGNDEDDVELQEEEDDDDDDDE